MTAWTSVREVGHPGKGQSTVFSPKLFCSFIASPKQLLLDPPLHFRYQSARETRDPKLLCPSASAYSIAKKVKVGLDCKNLNSQLSFQKKKKN